MVENYCYIPDLVIPGFIAGLISNLYNTFEFYFEFGIFCQFTFYYNNCFLFFIYL